MTADHTPAKQDEPIPRDARSLTGYRIQPGQLLGEDGFTDVVMLRLTGEREDVALTSVLITTPEVARQLAEAIVQAVGP